MDNVFKHIRLIVAFLVSGSAALLISCESGNTAVPNPETMVTQQSDDLLIIVSKNGIKSYRAQTPRMMNYELARDPYSIYPEGVFVETFRDSTEEVESSLIADFAINYTKHDLWEANGNVVAVGAENRTLYTEQLFWDKKTGRIYSNVDCKIVQGDEIFIGEGIESDDKLKNWTFHNNIGKIAVDMDAGEDGSADNNGDGAGNGSVSSGEAGIVPDDGDSDGQAKTEPSRRTRQPVEGEEIKLDNGINSMRPADGDDHILKADTSEQAEQMGRETHDRSDNNK